jgi:hypothetical protein
VLESSAKWFGVTYRKDREHVLSQLNALIASGQYPEKLW